MDTRGGDETGPLATCLRRVTPLPSSPQRSYLQPICLRHCHSPALSAHILTRAALPWRQRNQLVNSHTPHPSPPLPACPPPQVLLDALLQYTDAGVATSADAVVTFDEVAVLAPRGRYQVEMHTSFLKLVGQVRREGWLVVVCVGGQDASLPKGR